MDDQRIVRRTFSLVTDWQVIPYYLLAIFYSFWYAPTSFPPPHLFEYCLVKVLPLIYLLELVRHAPFTVCQVHGAYCRYLMMGLTVCAIADAVLVWDQEFFLPGVALFCVGHFLYTAAFYQYYRGSYYSRIILPINLAICAALIYVMQDTVPVIVVIIYTIFITTMAFFALSRLEKQRIAPAYLGWAGVKLFMLSDIMLAINELAPQFERPVSDTVVVMTYYLAQLGIALSVYAC